MATVITFTGIAIRLTDYDFGSVLDFPIAETFVFYDSSIGRVRFSRIGSLQPGVTVEIADSNFDTVEDLRVAIDGWSESLTGPGGGAIGLEAQTTAPDAPTSGVKLFSPANNNLSWRGVDTRIRTLAGALTGNRTYTLPDKNGTFAMLDDVVATETDPTVPGHVKAITSGQITAWNNGLTSLVSNSVIYQSNYAANSNGVNFWLNGGSTSSRTGGQLIISNVDDSIGFGDYTSYKEGQLIHVFIDFVKTGADVLATAHYGGGGTSNFRLSATGKYFFTLKRRNYTYPLIDFNTFLLTPIDGTGARSFTLNSLTIIDGGTGFDTNHHSVVVGMGASQLFPGYDSVVIGKNAKYMGNFQEGTIIGSNARSDQQNAVVIGGFADGNWDDDYGCGNGSDLVAVGYKAKAFGWRTTAIGASAGAGGQSSTAFGAGAWSGVSHGVAFGRGAFLNYSPPFGLGKHYTGTLLAGETRQIYFGNGWAHRFPPHPINDTEYGVNDDTYFPADRAVVIHGLDAFDSRPVPSSFNIPGGDLALFAGRGTGTGASGKISFLTAPPSGVGQNEKNPGVVAFEIDAGQGAYDGTRLLVLDLYNNQLKRVKLAPADGSNRMVLYVDATV